MPQDETTHRHSVTASVEHMEEEMRALEGETGRRRWILWVLGIVILAAVVAGLFFVRRGAPSGGAPSRATSEGGVPLDLVQPRPGSRLTARPTSFSWESVSGRHDYMFKLLAEDSTEPILTRIVKSPFLELTSEEAQRLQSGKRYVWTVAARRRTGDVIGSGQTWFRLD